MANFDQHEQQITNQYNAAGNINFGPVRNRVDLDLDVASFSRFQKVINSEWIQYFESRQLGNPQFVFEDIENKIYDYIMTSKKPENEFINQEVAVSHTELIRSMHTFLVEINKVTVIPRGEKIRVIMTKEAGHERWIPDYSERYDREVMIIVNNTENIIDKYKCFIRICRQAEVYK